MSTSLPGLPGGDTPAVSHLVNDSGVQAALETARRRNAETLDTQIRLSEIPAPPFGEGPRGAVVADLMRAAGLDVRTDGEGNVVGTQPGTRGGEAPVTVAAHLDTVFPEGTDVRVRRDGDTLRGPGITDNARGLAVMLAVARALHATGLATPRPVVFAATVGEEGPGNLRGARRLLEDLPSCAAFVALDGAGLDRVVHEGLGSRRFRVTARGPGGHSWEHRGRPNPIHALAPVVAHLAAVGDQLDADASLAVTRCHGGTSVNAIPREAWVEVDARARHESVLERLEGEVRRAVDRARAEPAFAPLDWEVTLVGARPAGSTPWEAPLVRAARDATRFVGEIPVPGLASTDANVAMARGIPAVMLGGGGEGGDAHTLQEWYRDRRGAEGVVRALLTVLAAARL